jgi:hypothetical protein
MGPQDPKDVARDTARDLSAVVGELAALKDVRRRSAMFTIALPCPAVGSHMREGGVAHAKPSTSNAARRPMFLPVHSVVDCQRRLRKATMPARITNGQLKIASRKVTPSLRAVR